MGSHNHWTGCCICHLHRDCLKCSAMSVIAGATPKYLLRLKDELGNQLDPSDPLEVTEVKVFISNAITGVVIARFILNVGTLPEGYSRLTVKNLGDTDNRVLMVLTSAMTNAAKGNSNLIQVDLHVPDTEAPDGTLIIKRTGKFHEIFPSKT